MTFNMHTIHTRTLSDAHEKCIDYVLWNGKHKHVNDQITVYTPPLTMVISEPLVDYRFTNKLPFKQKFMDEYASALLNGKHTTGTNKDDAFEYDYHGRLNHWGKEIGYDINQIDYCIDKLIDDPASRRAVAITWQPPTDSQKEDVPCLQLIQFSIDHDRLRMFVLFRSNDMLLAAGANMYALTELQRYAAAQVKADVGEYMHISLIPHIYIHRDINYIDTYNSRSLAI